MTRRGLEIRVGFVIVLAGVILVFGTMWFQQFRLAEKRYNFHVVFSEVGGLELEDPIFVNGVERGRVKGVTLMPDHVVVEMAVREDVSITTDSDITLKSIGIMGERFVAISQGTSPVMVAPGDTIGGDFLMGMSEVMGTAGSIMTDVSETARSLKEVAEMLAGDGKLQESMENFADISGNLKDMTGEGQPLLGAIVRFEHAATLIDSLMTSHYASLDSSMASFGRAGGKIDVAVDNLSRVSDDLKEISASLRRGDGTLGRLINDEELIDRLESTVGGLDSLILDMKMHPGRYVTFKIF